MTGTELCALGLNEVGFDAEAIDALGVDARRQSGAMKWLRHPDDVLGSWISEMDFGVRQR